MAATQIVPQAVPAVKIALYLRVSTDKQETENQAMQLREFAAKQDWQIVREYCDYESGSKSDRAEFGKMFADASRRKFDLVLFWTNRLAYFPCQGGKCAAIAIRFRGV
jgi:predicted site-specific integrase-resolvase